MPYSVSKTLKPSGTRSAFTFILCKLPISVSSAVPVFLHREHLRTSTQWSSVAILQICADGWQVLSVIARGLRRSPRLGSSQLCRHNQTDLEVGSWAHAKAAAHAQRRLLCDIWTTQKGPDQIAPEWLIAD